MIEDSAACSDPKQTHSVEIGAAYGADIEGLQVYREDVHLCGNIEIHDANLTRDRNDAVDKSQARTTWSVSQEASSRRCVARGHVV